MWLAVLLAAVIHSNANPTPRKLGAFYFNGPNESQIWVDLDPQPVGGGASPVRLNVTVKFRGRELSAAPKTVTIRASAGAFVAPTHVRLPVLQLHLSDDTVLDLTGPGSIYAFVSGTACAGSTGCPADTVVADVPFSVLERITASTVILVNALGFEMRLVQEDTAAIRQLVEAVRDGAKVK